MSSAGSESRALVGRECITSDMAKPTNPDINPFGDKPTQARPNINPSGPTTGTEGWGLRPDEPEIDQGHLNPKVARAKKPVRKSVPPRRPRKREKR